MITDAANKTDGSGRFQQLRYGREILREEARTIMGLADGLDDRFCQAVDWIAACRGSVIVSGMGKAGLIGQKIAATMASTGTRSHYLHPAEALHGDLGRVHHDDLAIILSYSGETEEVVRLLPSLHDLGVPIIAVTGQAESQLGRAASLTLELGPITEVCSLRLAPSASTTAMLALGDAMALVTSRVRGFGAQDFARFHPGGSLGRKLAKVEDVMRPLEQCRVADESLSVRDVIVKVGRPGRRTGAVMLTNSDGVLTGVFTDSDLARLFEAKRDGVLDRPVSEVMTRGPATVWKGARMAEAVEVLASRKISELPVVDADRRPCGLIDITDVVSLLPREEPTLCTPPRRDTTAAPADHESATIPFPGPSRGTNQ